MGIIVLVVFYFGISLILNIPWNDKYVKSINKQTDVYIKMIESPLHFISGILKIHLDLNFLHKSRHF